MMGNVFEWVLDRFHETYAGAPADGPPWMDGTQPTHVVRGGGWGSSAFECRTTYRLSLRPIESSDGIGCRAARPYQVDPGDPLTFTGGN